jgi:hypothetical protein
MKTWVAAILVSVGLAGSAWGQSVRPQTAADLAKYSGADRERLLYEGAKKEGRLVWYTSLTPYKEIAKNFETRYPGVTVEPYRAPATNLATRILGEAQARRYIADAIETTPGALMLRDNKLLLPFYSPHVGDYPEGSKEKAQGGLFFTVVDRESYPGIGYNKNAIRESDVAKSFDDLLKPTLKGKIGISGEEIGNRVIGAIVKAKGEGFIKKLVAQDIKTYGMPALGLNELIVSGEVPLTFTTVDSNIRLAAARAPRWDGWPGSGPGQFGKRRRLGAYPASSRGTAVRRFPHRSAGPESPFGEARLRQPAEELRIQALVPGAGFDDLRVCRNHRALEQDAPRNLPQVNTSRGQGNSRNRRKAADNCPRAG